nr:MAG TPA: hypothetical protein [Caudoviricetes sp.]
MLMLMIMYEDYRLHHARARALYIRRGRIQLIFLSTLSQRATREHTGLIGLPLGYRCGQAGSQRSRRAHRQSGQMQGMKFLAP